MVNVGFKFTNGMNLEATGDAPQIAQLQTLAATINARNNHRCCVRKNLKGSSSRFVTSEFGIPSVWQGDYAAFTARERNLEAAMAYVQNQKTHHIEDKTIQRYEPSFAPPNPDDSD